MLVLIADIARYALKTGIEDITRFWRSLITPALLEMYLENWKGRLMHKPLIRFLPFGQDILTETNLKIEKYVAPHQPQK